MVYAEPGETVQWAITLTNSSLVPALLTRVTDTLPSNLVYVGASGSPSHPRRADSDLERRYGNDLLVGADHDDRAQSERLHRRGYL